MSTEEKELEVTSTEAPKKPARKPRKPVDPAVWEELKAMQESGEVLTVKINAAVNVGDIYDGKVERITSFGAFVGFADDLSGLVHISQMANKHIESPNEVVKVGDEVKVKVIGKKDGKISLSMKAALDADAEVVDNREPAFNYKEEGQAATSLASLLAGIKLD